MEVVLKLEALLWERGSRSGAIAVCLLLLGETSDGRVLTARLPGEGSAWVRSGKAGDVVQLAEHVSLAQVQLATGATAVVILCFLDAGVPLPGGWEAFAENLRGAAGMLASIRAGSIEGALAALRGRATGSDGYLGSVALTLANRAGGLVRQWRALDRAEPAQGRQSAHSEFVLRGSQARLRVRLGAVIAPPCEP